MAQPTATGSEDRIAALDGLRGIAVLLVMACHLFVLDPQGSLETGLHNLSKLGMFGVDLFFVLSGFLITVILLRTRTQPGYFRNFYARRALRILPLYYTVVLVCFLAPAAALALRPELAAQAEHRVGFLGDWPWYAGFGSNVLFTVRGNYQHAILDVTWSLALEEQFYLLWPLAVCLLSRRRLLEMCTALVITAAVVRLTAWSGGWNWVQIYVFPLCRMDGLALGGLVALCWSGQRDHAPAPARGALARGARWAWVLGTGSLLALFAAGVTMDIPDVAALAYYPLAGLVATASLLVALTTGGAGLAGRILTSRPLRFFGKYSFALYLFHFPVRALIADHFFGDSQIRQLPVGPLVGQALFYVVATAAVIPVALLSWRVIEAPCMGLKSWFESSTASPRSAASTPIPAPQPLATCPPAVNTATV